MNYRRKSKTLPGAREGGAVGVEFIFLFPLYLLLLVGIVEFGHLWYVRHTLTNATREGARAAVVYTTTADRIAWAQNAATTAVNNYLNPMGPDGEVKHLLPGVTLMVPTPQVSGSSPGSTVTVSASASNVVLILDSFVPAFKDATVSAETTMRME